MRPCRRRVFRRAWRGKALFPEARPGELSPASLKPTFPYRAAPPAGRVVEGEERRREDGGWRTRGATSGATDVQEEQVAGAFLPDTSHLPLLRCRGRWRSGSGSAARWEGGRGRGASEGRWRLAYARCNVRGHGRPGRASCGGVPSLYQPSSPSPVPREVAFRIGQRRPVGRVSRGKMEPASEERGTAALTCPGDRGRRR